MADTYIKEEGWFGSKGYYYMDLIPGVSIGSLRWGCPIETAKRILAKQYPKFYKKGVEKEIITTRDTNQYIRCPGEVTLTFINGKLDSADIERTIWFSHWRILVNGKRLEGDTPQTIMFNLGMTSNPDMAKGLYLEVKASESQTTYSNGYNGGVGGGLYGGSPYGGLYGGGYGGSSTGYSHTTNNVQYEFKIIAKAGITQPQAISNGNPASMFKSTAPAWEHDDEDKVEEKVQEQEKSVKKPSWMSKKKNEHKGPSEENRYMNKEDDSFMEDEDSLITYYNQLKNRDTNTKVDVSGSTKIDKFIPGKSHYYSQVSQNSEKLKDDCCQHIILNIYLKSNPMDDDYKNRCYNKMNNDIDNMMASRGMSPAQYLTAAAEKTKSPVLEYLVRGVDKICKMYREDAYTQYQDALNNNIKLDTPPAPDLTDGNINKHLVDLEGDPQAQEVIAAIENQTKSQIVNNISNLLINKKQEDDMNFNPEPNESLGMEESTISIGMDYINHYMMINESSKEINNDLYEEFLGLCVRESVLDEINKCLGMSKANNKKEFKSTISFGNGTIVNEVSIDELVNAY